MLASRQGAVAGRAGARSPARAAPRPAGAGPAAPAARRLPAPPAPARGRSQSQGSVADGLISVLKDELKVRRRSLVHACGGSLRTQRRARLAAAAVARAHARAACAWGGRRLRI
jgi:hypothetical protein